MQTPRVAILELSKEMAILLPGTKSCFSPPVWGGGGGTTLSAAVLRAYSPPSPPTPTPAPHQAQVNSCILILVNTHLCLSFQSLSVKHHFFGKGPEVVLSELIFF